MSPQGLGQQKITSTTKWRVRGSLVTVQRSTHLCPLFENIDLFHVNYVYLKEEKNTAGFVCSHSRAHVHSLLCVFEWAYRWPCVWKIACCWSMDSKPAVFASLSSTVSVCTVHTVQHTQSIVCRSIQLTVCFSHLFIMPFIISSLHQLLSAFLEKY